MGKAVNDTPKVWIMKTSYTGDTNNRLAIAKTVSPDYEFIAVDEFDPKKLKERMLSPPDIFITGEECSCMYAATLKYVSQNKVFVAGLQTPNNDCNDFDLPGYYEHVDMQILFNHLETAHCDNGYSDPRKKKIYDLVPSRVDEAALKTAYDDMPDVIRSLTGKQPVYMVVIGNLKKENLISMMEQVADAARKNNAAILVSTSRRTDTSLTPYIEQSIKGISNFIYDWHDTKGLPSPYMSMLAVADRVIVSVDSLSMIADGMATGVPTHVYASPAENGSDQKDLLELFKESEDITGPEIRSYVLFLARNNLVYPVHALGNEIEKTKECNSTSLMGADILEAWKKYIALPGMVPEI